MPPFRMQAWSSTPAAWSNMDEGKAASAWRPRPDRDEAIRKCLAWTGLIAIPAMQVIDVATGDVVWRDSRHYPDAGPTIPASRFEWEKLSSGALDPAALEVGAERNLVHPEHDRAGEFGFPRCEHLNDGLTVETRCGTQAVGPFDHFCYRHWCEEREAAWPQPPPQMSLEEFYFDDRLPRILAREKRR